jgi:hypothetical protein
MVEPAIRSRDKTVTDAEPAPADSAMIFRAFAVYVIARQIINLFERFVLSIAGTNESFLSDVLDTLYLVPVLIALCLVFRAIRDRLAGSDLTPFYLMMAFSFLLPYFKTALGNVILIPLFLTLAGGEAMSSSPKQTVTSFADSPYQIVMGIGAALIWHQVVKRVLMLGPREALIRGQLSPSRRIRPAAPLFLFVIALEVARWCDSWIAYHVWHSDGGRPAAALAGLFPYSNSIHALLMICLVTAVLFAFRKVVGHSTLSAVIVVLAFVEINVFFFNLIDSEIMRAIRWWQSTAPFDHSIWETRLHGWEPRYYLDAMIYRSAINLTGAAVTYRILMLVFAGNPPVAVRRHHEAPEPEFSANESPRRTAPR